MEHEDVVGAAPIGDAPTTSEWSSNSLPTKVRLIWGLTVCDPLMIIWPHLKLLAHILSVIYNYQIGFITISSLEICFKATCKRGIPADKNPYNLREEHASTIGVCDNQKSRDQPKQPFLISTLNYKHIGTSTVYWCMASILKASHNFFSWFTWCVNFMNHCAQKKWLATPYV